MLFTAKENAFICRKQKRHSEKEDFQSALCGKFNSLCCQFRALARSIILLVQSIIVLVRLNRLPYAIKQTA